jgi:hypothetical protein
MSKSIQDTHLLFVSVVEIWIPKQIYSVQSHREMLRSGCIFPIAAQLEFELYPMMESNLCTNTCRLRSHEIFGAVTPRLAGMIRIWNSNQSREDVLKDKDG